MVKTARDAAARYPIRAVSKQTGIAIDTLRAWERRHGVVTPARDDRGRMYTDADVARLRLLRDAVEQGHSIGRLAGLSDRQLRPLAAPAASAPPPAPATAADATVLDAAVRRYDAAAIDQEVARLASLLSPLDLLQNLLMPALVRVGEDWHRRRAGVAHEHLLSSSIRHVLGSFLRLHSRGEGTTRLMFATPAGDRHEIGILGAAMLAASSGLGVAYLGPDLPAGEIVAAAKATGARVVVLGLTTAPEGKSIERELRALARGLPADIEVWAGGRGAERHAAALGARGLVFADYVAYQKELVRLGGRMG